MEKSKPAKESYSNADRQK